MFAQISEVSCFVQAGGTQIAFPPDFGTIACQKLCVPAGPLTGGEFGATDIDGPASLYK